MTKPFPCNQCGCGVCSDWSQPWFYRCCNWDAGPAAFKSALDNVVFNFGVMTPTASGISWVKSTPTSGSYAGDKFFAYSTLPITYDQTITCNVIGRQESFPPVSSTGTITYRVWDVSLSLVHIYSSVDPCKRSHRLILKFKYQIQDYELVSESMQADFENYNTYWLSEQTSQSAVLLDPQNFSIRSENCSQDSGPFVPRVLENGSSAGVGAGDWYVGPVSFGGFGRRLSAEVTTYAIELPEAISGAMVLGVTAIQRTSIFPACETPIES